MRVLNVWQILPPSAERMVTALEAQTQRADSLRRQFAAFSAPPSSAAAAGAAREDTARRSSGVGTRWAGTKGAGRKAREESAALVSAGLEVQARGQLAPAREKFERATALDPSNHDAHNALAIALLRSGELARSAEHSRTALKLSPEGRFHVNLGAALYEMRDFLGAIRSFEAALQMSDKDVTARLNLANALTEVHLFSEAIRHFEHVLVLQPSYVEARANMERNKETVCDWAHREQRFQRLRGDVEAMLQRGDVSLVRPWHALSYPWPAELLKGMSRSFADKTLRDVALQGLAPLRARPTPPSGKRRLVVGYVSYCFSAHPTTYLLGSVFRLHDRARVEVHCYALNAPDESPQRAAVEQECEGFHEVHTWPTAHVATAINRNNVHVTVNLDGWTSMGRTNEIFALTPAPVQLQYMGYPGSLAAPYVPWLLTDRVISPPEMQAEYSEKLLLHARGYYVNDYVRLFPSHPPAPPTRQRLARERVRVGLPAKGPVLVNLNNLYKVSPQVFALWMRVLLLVPQASLTVLALPEDARPFLQLSAQASLGAHSRLHFVDYLSRSEHLARASMATVFLDTLLVNAHTTAMDVIWAGLPLVTTPDTRFASRVAASILVAASCTHTLARSHDDYVDLAVRLASSASAVTQVRQCLSHARSAATRAAAAEHSREGRGGAEDSARALFDTAQWVRGLERMLGNLWDVHAGSRSQAFHLISGRTSTH